jgi:hypothetical protein
MHSRKDDDLNAVMSYQKLLTVLFTKRNIQKRLEKPNFILLSRFADIRTLWFLRNSNFSDDEDGYLIIGQRRIATTKSK